MSGTLSFTSDDTEMCVAISVEDDSERESVPECFTFSLVDATGDIVDPSVATVCIEDNDGWFYRWVGNQKHNSILSLCLF